MAEGPFKAGKVLLPPRRPRHLAVRSPLLLFAAQLGWEPGAGTAPGAAFEVEPAQRATAAVRQLQQLRKTFLVVEVTAGHPEPTLRTFGHRLVNADRADGARFGLSPRKTLEQCLAPQDVGLLTGWSRLAAAAARGGAAQLHRKERQQVPDVDHRLSLPPEAVRAVLAKEEPRPPFSHGVHLAAAPAEPAQPSSCSDPSPSSSALSGWRSLHRCPRSSRAPRRRISSRSGSGH
mmetsp:Transcript_53522/g.148412  ORF Transcript_53522/g.148412 Transcript_53522/m.148412 type:complete len:233 (-) Transcript_53522:534-1232(-)